MVNFLVGALGMAVTLFIVDYARRNDLVLRWWQWVLSCLAVIYGMFVVLLVAGFMKEGAAQAALVMSLIMGLPGLVFFILLVRFLFLHSKRAV